MLNAFPYMHINTNFCEPIDRPVALKRLITPLSCGQFLKMMDLTVEATSSSHRVKKRDGDGNTNRCTLAALPVWPVNNWLSYDWYDRMGEKTTPVVILFKSGYVRRNLKFDPNCPILVEVTLVPN